MGIIGLKSEAQMSNSGITFINPKYKSSKFRKQEVWKLLEANEKLLDF